ncbi:peptidoglycan-binding protein [Synechococcus moorigangaii CMS01]|nr:peptidoglycan-binding protein [Synechococcus moorigangaii CMS01]
MNKLAMFARRIIISLALVGACFGGNIALAQPSSRPELRIGSTGTIVSELQTTLRLLGYYNGEATGTYDEATVIAVYQFQQAAKIPQTGVMDSTTWDTLFPVSATTTTPTTPANNAATETTPSASTETETETTTTQTTTATPASTPVNNAATSPAATTANPNNQPLLKEGMEGEAVKLLQTRLKAMGYYNGVIDGIFGPNTRLAVIAAQTALKLDGDGIVGPQTWRKLLD